MHLSHVGNNVPSSPDGTRATDSSTLVLVTALNSDYWLAADTKMVVVLSGYF